MFSPDGTKLMWTSIGPHGSDKKSQLFIADFVMEPARDAATR